MGKNHAELYSITPFKENDRWYLKLIYKYENKQGKHTVVIPKAEVPFVQTSVPYPNNQFALERPYIDCGDSMPLYEAVCDLASERGAEEPAYYFDIVIECASREMTLDEIEKELGYKVKIINKEKKNAEN